MKNKYINYGFLLSLFTFLIIGCDEYIRTEVEKDIYVNKLSITAFVGEEVQLEASPTDGTYQYNWTSEDATIATVNSNGLVTIISEGNTNIIVSSGDVSRIIPVTAVTRIPLTDVVLSETSLELLPGARKAILVTNVPDNANDLPSYSWHSENPEIVTVNEIGELTVVSEGITNIVYRIGNIEKKVLVDVAYTRPFKGPHILSAESAYELMAAHFDLGGQGYAFHDADAHSRTGNNYRAENGDPNSIAVEIEGNGANIGYTNPGEWLLYTVEVVDAGDYLIEAQVAVPGSGSFHIEVNGVNVSGTIEVPNTGGWGSYQWLSTPEDKLTVNLTEGRHKIKYYFEGGHNFRSLRFTKK